MTLSIDFLRWGYFPDYTADLTGNYVGEYSLEYIGGGGMELRRDGRLYELEGHWVWLMAPGHRYAYRPMPRHGFWSNRYLVVRGPLVEHWLREGLLPTEPQAVAADEGWGARLDEIMALARRPDPLGHRRARVALEGLLLALADARRLTDATAGWLAHVVQALQAVTDEAPDYAGLAAACGYSLRALQRNFAHAMGVSLHAYVIHQRLQQAREALDQTDLPITAIAARLGYANVHYFSRQFTQHTGMTPTAYRQQRGR